MPNVTRILSVIDPTADKQPAFERSAWLANKIDAKLELFICDYDQYLAGERFFDSETLAKARKSLLDKHERMLSRLAKSSAAAKLDVGLDARWDYPLDEGIVRKALESKADLVVKDTHYHPVIKRAIFSNTDWELIRKCPLPLLLVKNRGLQDPPHVLAAVDPVHEHDKPAALDRKILEYAQWLASASGGDLRAVHAFDPTPAYMVSADSMAFPISVPLNELKEALRAKHSAAMEQLIAGCRIDKARIQTVEGETRDVLVGLAEKHAIDVLVMGAVSRSPFGRLLLGSTAEQVLDHLPCDLLIIRPDA